MTIKSHIYVYGLKKIGYYLLLYLLTSFYSQIYVELSPPLNTLISLSLILKKTFCNFLSIYNTFCRNSNFLYIMIYFYMVGNNMNKEKKKKRKKLKVINLILLMLFIILFITAIYSGIHIVKWLIDSQNTNSEIDNINKKADVTEVEDNTDTEIIEQEEQLDKNSPYYKYINMNLIDVDFVNLQSINDDTVGWVKVNGTNINYPFVQTTDNEYYLSHSFEKQYNKAGWVFLDYRNNLSNEEKNTIIYAHARYDETMFGTLKNVLKPSWQNNTDNHIVRVSTEYENTLWQVFSVYQIPQTSDYLKIQFSNNTEYIEFLNMILSRSVYNFNTSVNENDRIITLSTCRNKNDRVVLHAKLIKKEAK